MRKWNGEKKILRARSAEERAAQRREEGDKGLGVGKEVDAGENPPPPPSTTLFIPLGKSTNAKIFRVMTDLNPRRQCIGVYLYMYFELLFIPKLAYSGINLANIENVYNACTLYVVPNL